MVRYRSAEAAIDFVTHEEFGFYRHPFIGYKPVHDANDEESVHQEREICLLCRDFDNKHEEVRVSKKPD
jgi:hypothetical protein